MVERDIDAISFRVFKRSTNRVKKAIYKELWETFD
jgi:hypothetical protein